MEENVIRIMYRNKQEKRVQAAGEGFFNMVKEGFAAGDLGYVQLDGENGSLHIEFGDKCCNIQMDNEDKAEMYSFLNSDEPDGEGFVDLWATCCPRTMLCRSIDDVLKIIRTFATSGGLDPAFMWDVRDM
jgi:hypothetical protein